VAHWDESCNAAILDFVEFRVIAIDFPSKTHFWIVSTNPYKSGK
jgi:hypothetical protein